MCYQTGQRLIWAQQVEDEHGRPQVQNRTAFFIGMQTPQHCLCHVFDDDNLFKQPRILSVRVTELKEVNHA